MTSKKENKQETTYTAFHRRMSRYGFKVPENVSGFGDKQLMELLTEMARRIHTTEFPTQ